MPRHDGNTPRHEHKKNGKHRMHRRTRAKRLAVRMKRAVVR